MNIDFDDLVPVRLLGHGTLTEVMLVELPSRKLAAMKRALSQYRGDAGVDRLLRDEARVHAQLTHPSIPRLLKAGESRDGYALLFEALDGITLDEVLSERETLSLEVVSFIVDVLLDALAHAHDRGVVHRDVGPHNIVVTRVGEPVLIDFGIAVDDDRARWTATGALRGTLGYLAPEAVRGEPLDARADLFAVASTAFTLLTGVPAFFGKGPRQILDAVANGRHRLAREVDPTIPTALDALFLRGLAADPNARPKSAASMAKHWRMATFVLDADARARARKQLAARVAPHLPQQVGMRTRTLT